MNAKLTDDAVARLPLSHGRAELLEEIMRTPVPDDRPVRSETPRRRTRWLVPLAAAAAVVAAVATVPLWLGDEPAEPLSVATPPVLAGDHVLLDAPGWELTAMYADADRGEMTYENGDKYLELMWGPTASYDGYVEDRRHIVNPPADGEPITVLGVAAQMWPYSADDHTAIREIQDGTWIELRGSGMNKAGYLALLDRLELVDAATWEAMLPDEFVTEGERDTTVAGILDEIDAAADGPLLPSGVARSSITSDQNDDYQLGAEVAGAVACAWLDVFADATRNGNERRADEAAAILASSHDWPVLHRMNEAGDYPEVLWHYADQASDGVVPEGYAGGLGCESR